MEATERPWSVGVRQKVGNENMVALGDATGYVIARAQDEETAALIVKCVNAHDRLVQALRDAEAALDDIASETGDEVAEVALAKVRAALAEPTTPEEGL